VQRAQEVIASGIAQRVGYNAESGLDVLIEMGCGGELEVLIEPLLDDSAIAHLDALEASLSARQPAWMASVFAPGAPGQPRRSVWNAQGLLFDGIADPRLLQAIQAHPLTPDAAQRPRLLPLIASGGAVEVLLEPLRPPLSLVIVGSGAGAQALAPLAHALGWQVTLVEQDPARLAPHALPTLRTLCATPGTLAQKMTLDRYTAVVLMTHNLEQDIAYLRALKTQPLAYLGVIGSRERVASIAAAIEPAPPQFYAPAGLDIGSETPHEIALAITAEIQAAHHGRNGGSLRHSHGPIH
jgi:xanthine/CO dehydrogenase XdhC/CoxF family maturation factor